MSEFFEIMREFLTPEIISGILVIAITIINLIANKQFAKLREYGFKKILELEKTLPKNECSRKFCELCKSTYNKLPKAIRVLVPYRFIEKYCQHLFDTLKEALDYTNDIKEGE